MNNRKEVENTSFLNHHLIDLLNIILSNIILNLFKQVLMAKTFLKVK